MLTPFGLALRFLSSQGGRRETTLLRYRRWLSKRWPTADARCERHCPERTRTDRCHRNFPDRHGSGPLLLRRGPGPKIARRRQQNTLSSLSGFRRPPRGAFEDGYVRPTFPAKKIEFAEGEKNNGCSGKEGDKAQCAPENGITGGCIADHGVVGKIICVRKGFPGRFDTEAQAVQAKKAVSCRALSDP